MDDTNLKTNIYASNFNKRRSNVEEFINTHRLNTMLSKKMHLLWRCGIYIVVSKDYIYINPTNINDSSPPLPSPAILLEFAIEISRVLFFLNSQ